MKNFLLALLLALAGLGAQAQTMYINNHTACPVNVYYFSSSSPSSCLPVCGVPVPYVAGAYSSGSIGLPASCGYKQWCYAALNTNPNTLGFADGCQVGYVWDGNSGICNYILSGSFYVVSCGSFVHVSWQANVPGYGDVTIDIN
ncbi:MAG: hypothetical protein JST27_04380 [Bacteroidetes bacterium]|nr:hypothetical protein [Bacteroidota bacterium]